MVDHLKCDQFVIVSVTEGDEVKAGVAAEDELVIPPLKEIAKAGRAADNVVLNVFEEAPFVFLIKGVRVVFAQTKFALLIYK